MGIYHLGALQQLTLLFLAIFTLLRGKAPTVYALGWSHYSLYTMKTEIKLGQTSGPVT